MIPSFSTLPTAYTRNQLISVGDSLHYWDGIKWHTLGEGGGAAVWKGIWAPGTYHKNEMVRDGDYLMIANKETTERASPTVIGSSSLNFSTDPVFGQEQYLGDEIAVGHKFTLSKAGQLVSIRVKVPTVGSHSVQLIIGGVVTILNDSALVPNVWNSILVGPDFYPSGTVLLIVISEVSSAGGVNLIGNWNRELHQHEPHKSGDFVYIDADGSLKINKHDSDGASKESELLAIRPHLDEVFITSGLNFLRVLPTSDPVDDGGWISFHTQQQDASGTIANGALCSIEVKSLVATSMEFFEAVGYYPSNPQPSWAATEGYKVLTGVVQSGAEHNAYGIEVGFQEGHFPTDWDLMSKGN